MSSQGYDDDSAADANWNGFGIYIGYIFMFTIVTFLFDKFKLCDKLVHSLTMLSQEHLLPYILKDRHIDLEESKQKNAKHVENFEGECCDTIFGGKEKVSGVLKEYKLEYLEYLLDRPMFCATAPFDVPPSTGSSWLCCFLCKLRIAPGVVNDILLYSFNSHSLLSMFMATKGHPFSRAERRSAFLCQTCMALGFGVLASQLSTTDKLLLNVLVISPIMVSLKTLLYYLLACPCFRKCRERGGCARCFISYVEGLGWLLAVPIAMGCIVFLMGMVLITSGTTNSSLNMIASFAYSVHVISSIQEALMSLLMFWNGRHCFQIRFCYCTIFTVGKYLKEKIKVLEWEENKQYAISQWRICCCSCMLTIVHTFAVDDPSQLPVTKAVKASQVVPTDDKVQELTVEAAPVHSLKNKFSGVATSQPPSVIEEPEVGEVKNMHDLTAKEDIMTIEDVEKSPI